MVATGHSLGGALATLAAYDIRKQLLDNRQSNTQVVCYTFAAPRTGNHAFAREYNAAVPDTWSVINDQVWLCSTTLPPQHLVLKTHLLELPYSSGVKRRQVALGSVVCNEHLTQREMHDLPLLVSCMHHPIWHHNVLRYKVSDLLDRSASRLCDVAHIKSFSNIPTM